MIFAVDSATFSVASIIDILNHNEANAYYSTVPASLYPPKLSNFVASKLDARSVVINSTTETTFSSAAIYPKTDGWVDDILSHIDAQRDYQDNWDFQGGIAPSIFALEWAGLLAEEFSYLPMNERPQYSLDTDGRPTFSVYNDKLYLHLTVDEHGNASWYSVKNGVEAFEEDSLNNYQSGEFARKVAQI